MGIHADSDPKHWYHRTTAIVLIDEKIGALKNCTNKCGTIGTTTIIFLIKQQKFNTGFISTASIKSKKNFFANYYF
jgi:hypothetical protein